MDDETSSAGGLGALGTTLGALVVAWGAVIGSFPLNDNSFFTHLATGRLILETGSVPTSDPYTFTASGAAWTVQSWLPSVLYASAERAGGALGLRAVALLTLLVAAALVWRLSRPATSVVARLLIVTMAMLVSTGLWGERPYMFGVIGLGVIWLALDGRVRPWVLLPVMWIWANSHGSFPLGTVLVVTVLAGSILDRRSAGADAPVASNATEVAVLKTTLLGTLLAVIGPLGPDVLLFPLETLARADVLAEMVEWQPPDYQSLSERMFLVIVLATLVLLARRGSWRLVLPAVVFAGAGLYAQRNIVMATIVLVPVLAWCAPAVGTLTSRSRLPLGSPIAVLFIVIAALTSVAALVSPTVAFDGYPARAIAWLGPVGPPGADRGGTVTDMPTGNLLEVLDGARGAVFIDDRADMFPRDAFDDHIRLLRGDPRSQSILDAHDIDAVVWERSEPLATILSLSPEWRIAFSDLDWVVACRRGSSCG